jgi:PilZ domain
MSADKNLRRHRRIPFLGPIRISWEESGQSRFAMTRCIDLSETGLRIESPYPVPNGATVMLQSERIKLQGAATVKHSVRHGSKFLLGLQLTRAILGDTIAELEGRPVVTVLIENLNKIHQKV